MVVPPSCNVHVLVTASCVPNQQQRRAIVDQPRDMKSKCGYQGRLIVDTKEEQMWTTTDHYEEQGVQKIEILDFGGLFLPKEAFLGGKSISKKFFFVKFSFPPLNIVLE